VIEVASTRSLATSIAEAQRYIRNRLESGFWAIPSRPNQLRATAATGRIPAVRVVDARFPAV
jgi:hypothetical protein